jgi:hypothetical protein
MRAMLKIPSAVVMVLAASSVTCAMPCAAMPKKGSFLDHAGLSASTVLNHGAFSGAGSFHSDAARGAYFAAAAPRSQPEPYAMLLTGLGLLGLIARRRWRALRAAD